MLSNKVLAVVGLIAPVVLADTPQGYGYGGVSDSILAESTDSPDTLPSALMPITITNSITLTKPVTVTHTVTVSPDCGSETTTIYSTTRTTRTAQSTIFISVPATPKTSIETSTSVPKTGSSAITSKIPIASTTGYVVSNTTTSCDSNTTTDDVDGVTASLSSSLMSTITLAIPPTEETTSAVISGTAKSTSGLVATHTSSSTVPLSTIPTSRGVRGMADARVLAGAMGLISLVLTLGL